MNKTAWLGRLAALLILFASAVQLGAQPESPSPLDGLYVATKSGLQLNPWTNRLEYEVDEEYYLFFPDGRVYNALPKGGRFLAFPQGADRPHRPDFLLVPSGRVGHARWRQRLGRRDRRRSFTPTRSRQYGRVAVLSPCQ